MIGTRFIVSSNILLGSESFNVTLSPSFESIVISPSPLVFSPSATVCAENLSPARPYSLVFADVRRVAYWFAGSLLWPAQDHPSKECHTRLVPRLFPSNLSQRHP